MDTAQMLLAAYDAEDVKPGWVAFGIVIALCIGLFFLMRSMSHQLKKVRFEEFDLPRGLAAKAAAAREAADDEEPPPDKPGT